MSQPLPKWLWLLGMDPSMSNWGISCARYNTVTGEIKITHVDVIQTKLVKQKGVRANSLDIDRAAFVLEGILPYVQQANAIFVEVPVGSQSAAAMKSYAMCVSLLAALRVGGYPFHQLTPTQVKLIATDDPEASKKDMIQWAMTTHPTAPWAMQKKHGVMVPVENKVEHMADATAAIHAGIELEAFQQTLKE